MALVQTFLITLTGSAQQVTTSFGGGTIREIHLCADPTNVNPFYYGGSDVTTANGIYVRAPATGIPPPPVVIDGFDDGGMRADDMYLLGTAGEKIRVFVSRYI
jgi:hypothetical protein